MVAATCDADKAAVAGRIGATADLEDDAPIVSYPRGALV